MIDFSLTEFQGVGREEGRREEGRGEGEQGHTVNQGIIIF
jgi:hypothetical protein